ncbi:TonB-dependent receptor [Phenylobacterium sp.]|uniref:TonB-dependent receptor n=1 Tax=Phenylobacterium sp. TaxID=1871053 RepID=UPI00374CC278
MSTSARATRRLLFCTAAVMSGLYWATGAQAAAADAKAAASGGTLEEIVVTARKQEEKLQNVPLTVTALTSKAIEKLEIKTIFDLATVTPGVYFGTSGGRNGGNKLQIRNFSTGTAGPSKASVFIDGQYSPGDYASIPLANLERVEVLKGPQSAYFGRATFVGAVNFITRDPGNELTGKIDLVQATEGEHDYTGFISAPIIKDVLSEQITFREYSFTGPKQWRTTDGYHLGDQSTKSFASKTKWTPTDNITLKMYYAHVEDSDHLPPVLYADPSQRTAVIARPLQPGQTAAQQTFGYYFNGPVSYNFSAPSWGLPTSSFTNPGIRHQQDRFSIAYDWKVLNHTVSGYVGRSQEQFKEQIDGSWYLSGPGVFTVPNAFGQPTVANYGGGLNPLNFDLGERDTQFELRVTSPQDKPIRYTLGYNYSNIEGHAFLSNLSKIPIFYSNGYGGSFLNPARDNSVFGGIYWDVTEQITVSAEGRYQKERITAKSYSTAIATLGQTLSTSTGDYHAFLPRLNVQYKVNPNLQFYALYAEGNNPGGFQPITLAQATANNIPYAYAEEKLKDYEAGVKSTWLDGRLTVNAAIFHMDFQNEQLSQTTPVPGTPTGFASIYLPGVHSKVDGFEAEANAAVTEDFQIRATVGYGKAKYISFCSAPYGALTGVQTGLNCRSVAGKQQEGTPALQTSLSGDYTHRLSSTLALYARGDWEYQSKVYNEEWDQSWVPSHGVVNARVGMELNNWTFEGFVRNAGDDNNTTRSTRVTDGRLGSAYSGAANAYPTLGGFTQTIAGQQTVAGTAKKPRQYGVRLALKF